LKVAASTHRILLIEWTKPAPLEEFLLPPTGGLDWRVYPGIAEKLQKSSVQAGTQDTILHHLIHTNVTVLQVKFQSHDHGSIYYNTYRESTTESGFDIVFHRVWNILFTPSPALAASIEDTMRRSNLHPGQYTAAHLRALYTSDTRAYAMIKGWTQNAINCAVQLQQSSGNIPVYFASDADKALLYASSYGKTFLVDVIIRDGIRGIDPLHLDKTPDWHLRAPSDFFAVFIDLYMMSLSKGVTYGMGGYGHFASLMSKDTNNSIVHMSAIKLEDCEPPPRRPRRSGLHNYLKRHIDNTITANFALPMPPAQFHHQRQVHIVENHNQIIFSKGQPYMETLFPNTTNSHRLLNLWDESKNLPEWMKEYFVWHREQRKTLTQGNWRNMKYIAMVCLRGENKCGGTSDRLRPLPVIVRIAAESKRLLLIKWERPVPLESLLSPPTGGVDWRTPDWMVNILRDNGVPASTINRLVDVAAGKETIIKAHIQSHDQGSEYYNHRGEMAGDGAMSLRKHYRDCWYTFFTPVPALAKSIENEIEHLELVPGEFAVAHLRSEYDLEPGSHRDPKQLKEWTINAINCISNLRPGGPYFFSSDSSDAKNIAIEYGHFRNIKIVTSLGNSQSTVHLDMATSSQQDPILYYPVFIDLYMMSMGRCYAYNVGGFGKWANLISGRDFTCNIRHWTDGANQMSANKDGCQWQRPTNAQVKPTKVQYPLFLPPSLE
jgi:hypothetical protein